MQGSGIGLPKSYHFKTAMANLLKERNDTFCDELLDKETLFKETLR